jgi:hypothetical protein
LLWAFTFVGPFEAVFGEAFDLVVLIERRPSTVTTSPSMVRFPSYVFMALDQYCSAREVLDIVHEFVARAGGRLAVASRDRACWTLTGAQIDSFLRTSAAA